MPIHDWRKVDAGIFHHFHHGWIEEIARALNHGLLPPDHYALAEQIAGGLGPDVLTLQAPKDSNGHRTGAGGMMTLAKNPLKVWHHARTEIDLYAAKANVVAIRHASNHRVVAMVEIVSPGNKSSQHGLRAFVSKAEELLRAGVHLLIIDLFPPTPRDPEGIHKAIWNELTDNDFVLPPDRPLTLASYMADPVPEAFVEPVAVNSVLPNMPLFLTSADYVPVPLEATYQGAWNAVPLIWQETLTGGTV